MHRMFSEDILLEMRPSSSRLALMLHSLTRPDRLRIDAMLLALDIIAEALFWACAGISNPFSYNSFDIIKLIPGKASTISANWWSAAVFRVSSSLVVRSFYKIYLELGKIRMQFGFSLHLS